MIKNFKRYIVIDPSYAEESLSNYILTIFINLKTSFIKNKFLNSLFSFIDESIIHKINGKSIEYKKILEFEKESLVILEKIKNKINMFFENPSKTFEILL